MDAKPLTQQQQNVLRFIEEFSTQHGYPPTLREIGEAIGLANVNAVRGHLEALEKKGHITRAPDKARSIQVVRAPSAFSQVKRKLHEMFRTDEGVLHRIVYGLAWTTAERRPMLTGPAAEWMRQAFEREAMEHGWTIHDLRVQPDHVVAVVETWPNHSPERTVHRLQSAGKGVRRHHPDGFPGEALWEKGYAVTTSLDLLESLVAQLLGERTGQPQLGERGP
jgi:REP element-mobilizing transposase RayT